MTLESELQENERNDDFFVVVLLGGGGGCRYDISFGGQGIYSTQDFTFQLMKGKNNNKCTLKFTSNLTSTIYGDTTLEGDWVIPSCELKKG